MRSRLIPGKIKPISFTLVALVVIVTFLVTSFLFNIVLAWQLERIENATRSTQTAFSSEDNADVEQIDSENKSAYFVNDAEREFVERTVMAEAGAEGIRGMEAVSQVILDRSVLWNMTPVEVVSQESQYADMYPGEISDSVKSAVWEVFDNGTRVFADYTTHFHSGDEPYWASSKESRGSIGNHRFYY